jgi:Putative beta barrel porin-7 (BBP7)
MKGYIRSTLLVLVVVNSVSQGQGRATFEAPDEVPRALAPGPTRPTLGMPVAPTSGSLPVPAVQLAIPQASAYERTTLDAPVEAQIAPPSSGRVWADAEVLLWWLRPGNLPPLVTASPAGTTPANVGVLGAPGTTILFGGSGANGGMSTGGRFTIGYWLDCDQTCGIEAYYFQLASITQRFNSLGMPNVGRPFVNALVGQSDAQLVSFSGLVNGSVRADASTSSFLGAGVLARHNLCCGCGYRLDALAGYRFLSLADRVGVAENLTSTDPTQTFAPLGTNINVLDQFRAANQFHGADIGVTGEIQRGIWSLGGTARVALGATLEHVDIAGATTVTVPGFAPLTSPGGLLALSSNSGVHNRSVFAVVPEFRARLGCQISPRLRVFAGYTFLYWSQVVRAGDQIDLVVNPALLPPATPGASPSRPAFSFQGTNFWAQGIDLGLEFRF